MSEQHTSWYHCGRCGSLFQSPAGDEDSRLCPECGRNPSLGIEAPPRGIPAAAARPAAPVENPGQPGNEEKHSLRKRKPNYLMLKLVIGWALGLFVIVYGARKVWQEDAPIRKSRLTAPAADAITVEDIALLNEAGPLCNRTFSGYLSAGTPEERNQFVRTPITTAARMARFYSLNPLLNIDPATLRLAGSAVLHLPAGRAIETQWNSDDGRRLDAVFVEENGEWRLDWDHYARFSDYPWSLFLAGSGEPQGEFRLLARERLAEMRKDKESISIVLYAPRFGYANDTGFQSPEFLIPRAAKNGRLLDAAFQLEKNGQRVFGVKLPSSTPEGLIRVRVKVRRVVENMERRFELEEVVACHWYSTDVPGVEIPEQPAEK